MRRRTRRLWTRIDLRSRPSYVRQVIVVVVGVVGCPEEGESIFLHEKGRAGSCINVSCKGHGSEVKSDYGQKLRREQRVEFFIRTCEIRLYWHVRWKGLYPG